MEKVDCLWDLAVGESGDLLVFKGSFNPLTIGHVSAIRRACETFAEERLIVLPRPYTRGSPEATTSRKVKWLLESLSENGANLPVTICEDPTAHLYRFANHFASKVSILVGDSNEVGLQTKKWQPDFPDIRVKTLDLPRISSSTQAKRLIRAGDLEGFRQLVPNCVYVDYVKNGHPHV